MADFEPNLPVRDQKDKRILRSALEDALAFQVTDLLKIAKNSILELFLFLDEARQAVSQKQNCPELALSETFDRLRSPLIANVHQLTAFYVFRKLEPQ
jgi:hypothetical protein